MNIRFYLDPATGQPHIHDHGVDEQEVRDILEGPSEVGYGKRGARVATGQTASGRYLKVIYRPEPERDGVFVITAYELRGNALRSYRRRRRRKRR